MGFNSKVCNYTVEGRKLIHDTLRSVSPSILKYLMEHPIEHNSVELNDNRISLFSAQYGKCAITGEPLEVNSMEVHHVIPREMGGDDRYGNLIIVTRDVHKLIHATTQDTLAKYLGKIKPDKPCLERINKYRSKVGNISIS
jgi:5-methylcytosine-specific restriction endonuclease McrA